MVKRIGMVIVGATLVVAHCLLGGAAFLPLSRRTASLARRSALPIPSGLGRALGARLYEAVTTLRYPSGARKTMLCWR